MLVYSRFFAMLIMPKAFCYYGFMFEIDTVFRSDFWYP